MDEKRPAALAAQPHLLQSQKMNFTPLLRLARDGAAISITGIFAFPFLWWGLTAFKPASAIFDKDNPGLFNFQPDFDNFRFALGGYGPEALSAKATFINSVVIAFSSTAIALICGLMAAYAMRRLTPQIRRRWLSTVVLLRIIPPIAIAIPALLVFQKMNLFDTRLSVVFIHALFNLPIAILLLSSFMEDVPFEIDEAAKLDGAGNITLLLRVIMPMMKGGIAASAILCAIFSWTEFLLSLFLSVSFRTLPVKLAILPLHDVGPLAAAGTISMIPSWIFILFVQRHLVRGLTLGHAK